MLPIAQAGMMKTISIIKSYARFSRQIVNPPKRKTVSRGMTYYNNYGKNPLS